MKATKIWKILLTYFMYKSKSIGRFHQIFVAFLESLIFSIHVFRNAISRFFFSYKWPYFVLLVFFCNMKIFSIEKLVETTYRITLDLNLSYSFLNKFVIGCAHWPNTDSNLYQVPGLGKKIILALRRFSTTFTIFQNRVVIHEMQCGSLLVESD